MNIEIISNDFLENYEVFDRFTFDELFKKLLSDGCDHEEAKDTILYNCALSALVLQERIHNNFYQNISIDDEISNDLLKLKEEIANKILTKKITEIL